MTEEVKAIIDRTDNFYYTLSKHSSMNELNNVIGRDFFVLVDYIKKNHYTNITTEKLEQSSLNLDMAIEDGSLINHFKDKPNLEVSSSKIVHEVYVDSSMSTYLDDAGQVIGINKGRCRVTDKQGNELSSEIWDTPHSNNFYEARAIFLAALYFTKHNISNGIIYSDSQTARAWFDNGKLGKVKYNQEKIQKMIHHYNGMKQLLNFTLLRWNTKLHGENPADYGVKK